MWRSPTHGNTLCDFFAIWHHRSSPTGRGSYRHRPAYVHECNTRRTRGSAPNRESSSLGLDVRTTVNLQRQSSSPGPPSLRSGRPEEGMAACRDDTGSRAGQFGGMESLDHTPVLNPAARPLSDVRMRQRQPAIRPRDSLMAVKKLPAMSSEGNGAASPGGGEEAPGLGLMAGAFGLVFGDLVPSRLRPCRRVLPKQRGGSPFPVMYTAPCRWCLVSDAHRLGQVRRAHHARRQRGRRRGHGLGRLRPARPGRGPRPTRRPCDGTRRAGRLAVLRRQRHHARDLGPVGCRGARDNLTEPDPTVLADAAMS